MFIQNEILYLSRNNIVPSQRFLNFSFGQVIYILQEHLEKIQRINDKFFNVILIDLDIEYSVMLGHSAIVIGESR